MYISACRINSIMTIPPTFLHTSFQISNQRVHSLFALLVKIGIDFSFLTLVCLNIFFF